MIRFLYTFLVFTLVHTSVLYANDLPFELDPANSRWNAEVLSVPGKYIISYLPANKQPGNCNHTVNASASSPAEKTFEVKILAKNSEFGWKEMRIGSEWVSSWYPYAVRFSVQQSLKSSSWTVNGKSFTISGTHKQDIVVELGRMSKQLDELIFKSGDFLNTIQFSNLEIVRPSVKRYFMKTFEVNKTISSSELVISTAPYFILFINGKKVIEKGAGNDFDRTLTRIDCTRFLRKGINTVSVECESMYWKYTIPDIEDIYNFFQLEGIIYYEDGTYYRFFTDSTWKASFATPHNWPNSDISAPQWLNPISKGRVQAVTSGHGQAGPGWYTDPPYYGPIQIKLTDKKYPFFKENEDIWFSVTCHIPEKDASNAVLHYTIKDFSSYTPVYTSEEQLQDWNTGTAGVPFPSAVKLQQGCYLLETSLVINNQLIDKRYDEFVVIGKIHQETAPSISFDNLPLKRVDYIDCSSWFSLRRMLASPSRVLTTEAIGDYTRRIRKPFGSYRETRPNAYSWISYALRVTNPFKPHIIRVMYPDDSERTMGFAIHEKGIFQRLSGIPDNAGILRASSGVYTGGNAKISHSMQKLDILYWPNTKTPTLTIVNNQHNKCAAVSSIEVLELDGDLPALQIPDSNGDSLIGTMSERADYTLPRTFYAGPYRNKFAHNLLNCDFTGFYKGWYTTLRNFIQYMRFTGQNLYIPSLYMYYTRNYPCASQNSADISLEEKKDYFSLLAAMCEANDISLLLGIEFMGTEQTRNELNNNSDTQIRNDGADTLRLVSRAGQQAYSRWGQAGLDPSSPLVRDAFLSIIRECAETYNGFSSIKGFVIYAGGELFPSFGPFRSREFHEMRDSLNWGYGDLTIQKFESDTGIVVPSDKTSPQRFQQRFEFLTAKQKDTWIDWRVDTVSDIISKTHSIIKSYRPDWSTRVVFFIPNWDDINDIGEGKITFRNLLMYAGLNPDRFSDTSDLSFVPIIRQTGSRWIKSYFNDYNSYHHNAMASYNSSDEFSELFPSSKHSSAFIHCGFMTECSLETQQGWMWSSTFFLGYPVPADIYFLESYAKTMAAFSPTTLFLFWTDMMHKVGQEEELSRFTRSFRTLHTGNYKKLYSSQDLYVYANISKKNAVLYVVNTSDSPASLTIHTAARIHNISLSPEPSAGSADKNVYHLHLTPFALQTYTITSENDAPDITFTRNK
ncbi:MAG: hypothetical protein C4541_11325 [Candidatus Auribacter fodinae]|jgi:hypothetical protein|uniref:Uncharacterized protein n=1 Tax=Candidatus Auribacter fodinae TaxID=2093366 RepID=A0A3A4QW16_9BACT|nr:MAG: hypothetical protein C4541_11325 [Candidatus Auribacter fodinae]